MHISRFFLFHMIQVRSVVVLMIVRRSIIERFGNTQGTLQTLPGYSSFETFFNPDSLFICLLFHFVICKKWSDYYFYWKRSWIIKILLFSKQFSIFAKRNENLNVIQNKFFPFSAFYACNLALCNDRLLLVAKLGQRYFI